MNLEMVDEHGYKSPNWFWDNLSRWDAYDRSEAKVYLGEWAAHDGGRRRTLRAAIAEAAYWTALERNGDMVSMASYAPLLARMGNTQWNPDLIYFTNTEVLPTLSYQVQKLLGNNGGDTYLQTDISDGGTRLAASTVQDSQTGDIIIKLVNGDEKSRSVRMKLNGLSGVNANAQMTVLSAPTPTGRMPDAPMPRVTYCR